MNCRYCAEEIREAAIVCRFCGAAKDAGGEWCAPAQPVGGGLSGASSLPRAGSGTMKTSGVFFVLSGLFSVLSLTSDVPLFGAMRSGGVAIIYNLFFALLFLGMGAALILGRGWGYRAFMAGTAIYSLDRILFLLDGNARDAYLAASGVTREVRGMMDLSMIDEGVVLGTLLSVVCWWGFAVYVWFRRGYFC